MERGPKQSQERAVSPHTTALERSVNIPSRPRLVFEGKFQLAVRHFQTNEAIRLRVGVKHVEFGAMGAQQLVFFQTGGFRRLAWLPDNGPDRVDQADDFARRAVRPGILV